jgi:hypothetical protein
MIIIPNRALWAELTAVSMATSNATQSRYIVIGVDPETRMYLLDLCREQS